MCSLTESVVVDIKSYGYKTFHQLLCFYVPSLLYAKDACCFIWLILHPIWLFTAHLNEDDQQLALSVLPHRLSNSACYENGAIFRELCYTYVDITVTCTDKKGINNSCVQCFNQRDHKLV